MRTRLGVLAVLLVSTFARADGIVLEAYTNERPADATRLLSPIIEELTHLSKATAGDQLAREYDSGVSKSAVTAEGLPTDFADQVDRGFRSWVAGKFDESIKQLSPLIDTAHANSGAFAKEPALREPLKKALIALALSQQRMGDPGAMKQTFTELLRSYPDVQLSKATYGPDAFQAFDQVRHDQSLSGEGKLTVKVAQDGGVVFVDEAFRAMGTTTMALAPGEYRVLVMLNKQPSRTHRVTVRANGESIVTIDAELDQAIHTRDWTGFLFTSDAARDAHETQFAADFANSIKAPSVSLISIEQVKGHAAIVGSLVSLETGREIRRASVALDPDPSTDRLKSLARFLAGEEPAAGLDVLVGGKDAKGGGGAVAGPSGPRDRGEPAPGGTGRWGGFKYITLGVAAVGLGAGIYLAIQNGGCKETPQPGRPCNDVYADSPFQYVGLAVGGVFTIATVYLFATISHEQDPARSAYIVPTRDGAIAGYSFSW